MKLDGLLATRDIQKAFDSVDHAFVISTLERHGLAIDLLDGWKFYSKTTNLA